MEFQFDKLDSFTCGKCKNAVPLTGVAPLTMIACPHCKAQLRVPAKLSNLLLLDVVGTGSAGVVYKALDQTLHRQVAVKILRQDESTDARQIVEATLAEARALAAINHANVVHVHSIGMRHNQPYIVMELLLGGGKLNVMLKEGWTADEKRALEIGIDVAEGLRAAFAAGLLHRDVKPGNILFNDQGTAKLLDFSVIQASSDGEKMIVGTPYYISPEGALGEPLDFRSDMYSLGATLYHLITGQPVFNGESQKEIIRARLKAPAPDIRRLKPNVTASTAAAIARLLSTDPSDRHDSYDELILDLRECLRSAAEAEVDIGGIRGLDEALAVPATTRRRTPMPEPARKNNAPLIIGGAIAAVVVIGVILALVMGGGGSGTDTKDKSAQLNPPKSDDGPRPPVTPPENKDAAKDGSASKDAGAKDGSPTPPPPPQPTAEELLAKAFASWDQHIAAELAQPAWAPVTWKKMDSLNKAPFQQQADGSVIVAGGNPDFDTYTLEAEVPFPLERITAIRVEALSDASLPGGGPGRSSTGNFVLTQVKLETIDVGENKPRPAAFERAVADYGQPPGGGETFAAANLIDDQPQTGWGVAGALGKDHHVNLFVKPRTAGATIGQTRAAIKLGEFEAGEFEKWTATGNAFKNRPMKDGEVVLPNLKGQQGKAFASSAFGSAAGGKDDQRHAGTGTLTREPFTIERDAIAMLIAGGNLPTVRVDLKVAGKVVRTHTGDKSHAFTRKLWDVREFVGQDAVIEIVDEEKADRWGYILVDQVEQTDESIEPPASKDQPARLRVSLVHASKHKQHNLGKFRVSWSTRKDPMLEQTLPANILAIAQKKPADRSGDEAKELAKFHQVTEVDKQQYVPPVIAAPQPQPPPQPQLPAPGFRLRSVQTAAAGKLESLAQAQQLLAQAPAGAPLIHTSATINFIDPDSFKKTVGGAADGGRFPGSAPFPFNAGGDDNNWAMQARARVRIPEAGRWTFGVSVDDGAILDIGGVRIINDTNPGAAHDGFGVIEAPEPGWYDVTLVYFEGSGESELELYAAKGTHNAFTGDFKLVGDTAGGGLEARVPDDSPSITLATKQVALIDPSKVTPAPQAQPQPQPQPPAAPKLDPYQPVAKGKSRDAYLNDIDETSLIVIPREGNWQYWYDAKEPASNWNAAAFVASGWQLGESSFGHGYPNLKTALKKGESAVLYARAPFVIDNPATIGALALKLRYDDAIVVYINGKEGYRSKNMSNTGAKGKVGVPMGKSLKPEIVPLNADAVKALVKGDKNVIAIECHNESADDADFLLDAVLIAEPGSVASAGKEVKSFGPWKPADAELTQLDDYLMVKGKGAGARLEAPNLGHDYDANKAIYVSVYMKTAARGRMTMTYGWSHNNKAYTGDESKELAPGQWVIYTFSVRTPARINNIKLNLPIGNGEAAIKFVKVHPERTPPKKAAAEWIFEK